MSVPIPVLGFSTEVVMRRALERYANGATDPAIAIRALTELDGRSPYLHTVYGLWAAQGAYGAKPPPSRRRPPSSEPVDPEVEREARRESLRALRECWRTIWAELGAPVTVIRIGQQAQQ